MRIHINDSVVSHLVESLYFLPIFGQLPQNIGLPIFKAALEVVKFLVHIFQFHIELSDQISFNLGAY